MRSLRLVAAASAALFLLSACSSRDDSPAADDSPTAESGNSSSATATTSRSSSSTMVTPTPGGQPVEGAAEHDGARTLELVRKLSVDIGTRVSGTDGEDRAVEFIADEFSRLGYTVEVQPFEFDAGGFSDDDLSIEGQVYAARRFAGSATSAATGAAVYVGLADSAGLAGKDLAGKVAIADRGTLTFGEKASAVARAGAVGLVVVNTEQGLIAGRIEPASSIPVVGVGSEDGAAFKAAASANRQVSINVAAFTAKNVVAKPSAEATCDILVGGHHDSVPSTPGATDNASGTATVLELARAFAVGGLEPGLCFVTFGGEESGLHGSQYLAGLLEDDDALPRIYVNLDVTGTGSMIEVVGTRALVTDAVEIADRLDIRAEPSTVPAGTSSDHASFERVGVDVVYFATDDYSRIHTPGDSIDTIDAEILDDTGDLAYEFILDRLASFARG